MKSKSLQPLFFIVFILCLFGFTQSLMAVPSDFDGDGFVASVDCDDYDDSINPDAEEICDGVDNNCDTNIDEGVTTTYYKDFDEDGFGDSESSEDACTQPAGSVTNDTDCDDEDDAINPDAEEICEDGIDNNCDGTDDTCPVVVEEDPSSSSDDDFDAASEEDDDPSSSSDDDSDAASDDEEATDSPDVPSEPTESSGGSTELASSGCSLRI